MLKKFFTIVLPILLTILIFGIFNFLEQKSEPVRASASDNVSGFAWSENIGWISFNNTSGGGSINYGVNINPQNGKLSGYAWSENIGWISFAPAGPYPVSPNYSAKVDLGTGEVSGWARALANGGGWDGWIKMRGTNYGVSINPANGEFSGYGWSDMVMGWLSFKGAVYGVTTTPNLFDGPPIAAISCDASLCQGGSCNGSWVAFQPLANPVPCLYKIKNNSTDPDNNIATSKWYLNGAEKLICPPGPVICDYTLQTDVAPGDYTVKLHVEDTNGLFATTTHFLTMKSEVRAGFMCSLDNANWQACEALSNKISQGGLFYLKDDSSLTEYSAASQGAAITSRQWEINGVVFGGNETNPSVNLVQLSNTIRLRVTDNANRSDDRDHIVGASSPLPEWKEIPPF